MKYGSICSGIEAATVAWHPLGWKPAWFSEIASFPSALLDHYYPTVPNLGDMTKLTAMIERREIEAPDIVCGGTPCQAFSVSGNRQSLGDDRGNLSLVFCEVCNAVDDVRHDRGEQPAIIMWENVPGVLSTHDNAFGCFLAGLAGESEPVNAPNGRWPTAGIIVGTRRSVAWRVLDAQYFGLAQRRKRVFVVASARTDIDIGQILIEFDGVQRTTKPRRETGQSDTRTTAVGVDADSGASTVARAAVSIQGNIIDRNHGGAQGAGISTEDISYTLTTTDRHAVAFQQNVREELRLIQGDGQITGALSASTGTHQQNYVLWQALRYDGVRLASDQDTVPTLTSYMGTGGNNVPLINVRRLTPRECERLQGFPDDYTLIPYKGKDASDAVRYHALGNSWAVSVVRWIGRRIVNITK
jgi:DNA (cytosine-5)-methyltransferase 1